MNNVNLCSVGLKAASNTKFVQKTQITFKEQKKKKKRIEGTWEGKSRGKVLTGD